MFGQNGAVKRSRRRTLTVVCLLGILLSALLPSALAAPRINIDADCTLRLICKHDDAALEGISFKLYRVANVSASGVFTLSGDFRDYSVAINGLSDAEWKAAANTLAVYIRPDGITAIKTAVSDSNGRIDFGILSTGLYLLVCDGAQIGGSNYTAAPFLVSLPYSQGGAWAYDVQALPKIEEETQTGEDVDVGVIKVWNDSENRQARPESVEVVLLEDGAEYATVTLSADNAWRHTWHGLSGDSDWTVLEKSVPSGYNVTYTSGANALIITNTLKTIDVEGPTGSTGGSNETTTKNGSATTTTGSGITPGPGTTVPGVSLTKTETTASNGGNNNGGNNGGNNNGGNNNGGNNGGGTDGKLPQTGVLWWPVPLMSAFGLLLFGLGWMRRYGSREKDDGK